MIHKVNKGARATLDAIFSDMKPFTSKKIGKPGGTYQPLSAERLSENLYSMAHYVEMNGDLCADPDMEFYRDPTTGDWYPVSITQSFVGVYRQAIELDGNQRPYKHRPGLCRELASFAGMWCSNLRVQQSDYFEQVSAELRKG